MRVSLAEGDDLQALGADFQAIDQGVGRQAIGKPLHRKELVAESPLELISSILSHDETGLRRRRAFEQQDPNV